MKIKKAIFPVGGLGSRFLPATKANPKEMLPVVDKPLIQYAVDEAIAAGITELIFVTNSSKRAIEDHFDCNFELETILLQRGQHDLLHAVQTMLPKDVSCIYLRQHSPLGLGHAILCAKPLIMGEPFAVLLADDLISVNPGKMSCLQQMVQAFQNGSGGMIAVQPVSWQEVSKYGIVTVMQQNERLSQIQHIVEKPPIGCMPSNLGVVGRYILTPDIFPLLERLQHRVPPGTELQLTDGLAALLADQPVYAYRFDGKRYDCGNKLGYLEATVTYALQHPELADEFKQILQNLIHQEVVLSEA